MKRGSLHFLIGLLSEEIVDQNPQFVDTLLTTHPLFVETSHFLRLILALYEDPNIGVTGKGRIVKVLTRWLEYDLDIGNEMIIKNILEFAECLLKRGDSEKENGKLLYRYCLDAGNKFPPVPISSLRLVRSVKPSSRPTFLDIDNADFAQHLTAVDWDIFKRVKCTELLNSAWTKPGKEQKSPHMLHLVNRFNQISTWVAVEILTQQVETIRAKVLEKFIHLANILKDLKNYHSMVLISFFYLTFVDKLFCKKLFRFQFMAL